MVQYLSWSKEKRREIQEWNEQKLPKMLPGHSGGTLLGRSSDARGREEEEEEEKDSREILVGYEIVQEVVAIIQEKAGGHEDAKSTAQRAAGQIVKQSWVCSQIENEEEEEEEVWQREIQMELQWAEEEKLEKILERRQWKEALCRHLSQWCMNACLKAKK